MARKENFLNELSRYIAEYGERMIADFADYWTEPNRSCTKMRFELQPTWDTSRRLKTWASRENRTANGIVQKTTNSGKISPKDALRRMMEKMNDGGTQTIIEL